MTNVEHTDQLVQLADDVAWLTKPRELGQWVAPDRSNPASAAYPKLAEKRAGGFYWPPISRSSNGVHPALLTQLNRLRDGYAAVQATAGGHRPPGPRETGGSDVVELLAEIHAGTADLLIRALKHLHAARPATRTQEATVERRLELLVRMAEVVDEQLRDTICKRVHGWVNATRLVLSYAAPMSTLDMTCPYCRQQSLIVRSDASSDVFCTTDDCTDDNGNPPRWPRQSWVLLLSERTGSDG